MLEEIMRANAGAIIGFAVGMLAGMFLLKTVQERKVRQGRD